MRYLIIIFVTLFAVVQTQNSIASSYSQQLVAEGRVLLFDSNNYPTNNPTYSGVVAANEKFKSAVDEDPSDPLANLFYAFTRVMVSYIEQGDSAGIETVRDFLESIGLTRNLEENINFSPYDDPAKIDGTYVPPSTMPSGDEFQTFLKGEFLALIDSAIGNLNVITSESFTTTITPSETGDIYPIEIDYGDVLLIKSFLYTAKALIQILAAYDMDISFREIIILGNAGVIQIQRDLLDKYNGFLSLNPDGASRLTSAKTSLLLAIDTCRAAFTFITNETDDQNDDFFSFGTEEEVAEAHTAIAVLTEMQNSINANRPFTETEEEWLLSIVDGPQMNLYIIKDGLGNFVEGEMVEIGGGFYGWVTDYKVVFSTITIEFGFGDALCPGTLSTTGTLSGNQISGGTYNYSDCYESMGGSFSGTRQYTSTETPLDLNYIFGNTGKSPLNIRSILPEFDTDSDMIAGTFPQPYMNNLFPGITTELRLAKELGLPLVYDVQPDSITLDGFSSDWAPSTVVAEDESNDIYYDAPSGNDISKLYAARDSNYFYWMMQLNDPPTSSTTQYTLTAFGRTNYTSLFSSILDNTYSLNANGTPISSDPSDMGRGNIVEARIPLAQFNQTVKLDVGGWTNWDFIYDVTLRLPNDASISGSVSCASCTSSGKIFIYVFDGPDPAASQLLGTAVLDTPGSYSITGLPKGKTVYVYAHWDADDNGVQTYGDFIGGSHNNPVEILPSGTTGNITITDEIASPLKNAGIFAENRAYSDFFTNSEDYYEMRGWARSYFNYLPVYAQNIPHSSGPIQAEIPYLSTLDILFTPDYSFSGKFSAQDGFSLPGPDWEGETFPIFIDGNMNGTYDAGEPSRNWTIPEGALQQLDIPVVSISGRQNPTITWQQVPDAERYNIRLWSVTEENRLGDMLFSIFINADGSSSYSYTYDGDLFNQFSTLAVSVMADDIVDTMLYNRSTYITSHSIKNVNLPGVMLLLLD